MNKVFPIIKKIFEKLFNTRASGFYTLLFALSIAVATFIENDYGTSAAQKVVFKAWWFELLLLLFCITICVNIFKFRMIPQKKWSLLIFHSSIILIVLGAGITRYFGFEGVMHVREESLSNSFQTSETYLNFKVQKKGKDFEFNEPVLFASLGNNSFNKSYLIDNDLIKIKLAKFIPNPKQLLKTTKNGLPTLKVVIAGINGREEYFISKGQIKQIGNVLFNFKENEIANAFNLHYKNDSIQFKSDQTFMQTVMATQKKDTIYPNNNFNELKLRALYTDGQHSFVFGDFNKSAKMEIVSENVKVKNESIIALNLEVHKNNEKKEVTVFGNKGRLGNEKQVFFEDLKIQISYGSKIKTLPFSIKLNDFIMEKYPGTNAASSYASEVTVISREKTFNQRIYMNHILDMQGYRFFQSSFDNDEKGTYLSVNHDFIGTWVSYIGYILLTIGLLMNFFSKKTRFYQLTQKIKKLRVQSGTFLVLFFLFFTTFSFSQTIIKQDLSKQIIDANHANAFSKIVVQDHNGRMKPIHTLSREILRKLARKEQLQGYSADQILLSLFANNKAWYGVDIIKLGKHQKIRKQLNVNRSLVAYKDFFKTNGSYKLSNDIRRVQNLKPVDRGTYEKELLKIDERVNILTMAFSGAFLKIIPTANNENNTWVSTQEHNHANQGNQIAIEFFTAYKNALFEAMSTNDYTYADKLIGELKIYQKKEGSAVLPSDTKIKTELFLNNLNVFNKLALYYFLLGLAFLFFLFFSVFKPNIKLKKIYIILFTLVLIGFFFHTLGLGLRWYVSGRAPWSNGYESMIYIAWTSTLAGLLFTRKSFGGIAATMILASTILLVAMLSYLDPQITPLVPVLKSYWLTIHVSMEAGSYGFLLLGAIIGFINLVLMIFITKNNKKRIVNIIKEMSYISELTLIGGLVMISIGTYLGGVWANESWGRYWGWDAKETWALVTILIYVFILHMRIIPKLNGLFLFNVMSIFGMTSVIMTYYGVNYYLSGLHSYATGDPVPIPNWVYTVISVIVLVSVFAFIKKKKFKVK